MHIGLDAFFFLVDFVRQLAMSNVDFYKRGLVKAFIYFNSYTHKHRFTSSGDNALKAWASFHTKSKLKSYKAMGNNQTSRHKLISIHIQSQGVQHLEGLIKGVCMQALE